MAKIQTTKEQFAKLLATPEGTTLEVKEAANSYSVTELLKHCGAIYNTQHGQGQVVLGVTDKAPHIVKGTKAFPNTGELEKEIHEKLGISVEVEECLHENKRTLIFHIPASMGGYLVGYKDKYYIRRGAASVQLSHKEIAEMEKAKIDYSAQLADAKFSDLDADLVNMYIAECSTQQINSPSFPDNPKLFLQNIGLIQGEQATVASLVLLGSSQALRHHLPAAEISYLYKTNSDESNMTVKRINCQVGVWGHLDIFWEEINNHNLMQNYQYRLARKSIPTFDEYTIREAIINAIAHRDYTSKGAIFIKQFPSSIEITSPGGLLPNLYPDNLARKSFPRNELLADALQKAGRSDDAGTGIAMMNYRAMQMCKPLPDYSTSDKAQVRVVLDGTIVRGKLPELLHHSPDSQDRQFSENQYRVLCAVSRGEEITEPELKAARKQLLNEGILKSQGRGQAAVYALSVDTHIPYELFNGHRESVLELLGVIVPEKDDGISISNLDKQVASKSKSQIRRLLQFMARDNLVKLEGKGRSSVWVATHKGADLLDNES